MARSGPLTRLQQWGSSHPLPVDVAFAALIGVFTVLGYLSAEVETSQRPQDVLGIVLIVAQTVAFAFRRRAPMTSLLGVVLATTAFWVADYPTNFDAFTLLAVYAAVAHGGNDRRRVWIIVGGMVGFLTVVATLGVLWPDEDLPPLAVVGIAGLHLTAAVTGEVVHDRRRRLSELEHRAERAEAERELLARQAVLDERARIARDLHDVVAHGMTVMVVQAGAAQRMVYPQPDRAVEALGHVQATGREALNEMRRMLGVLRDGGAETAQLAPQPTLADIDRLVQHCNDAGIATEISIDGDRPDLAMTAEMTAYRIVQEALTNVVKHAGRPAHAKVRITYTDEHVRIEVDDDGEGASSDQVARSTGHGLVGMRERIDLFGGSFRAGPRPGGGFRVAATIPLGTTSALARGAA